jgi:putative transposase
MLLSILYTVIVYSLTPSSSGQAPRPASEPRFLPLRHQLRVLDRQAARPRWQTADRLTLAAISRILPRSAGAALIPSPDTLLRWHRDLVRRKWAAYRRRPRRRRRLLDEQLFELIVRMAKENPR